MAETIKHAIRDEAGELVGYREAPAFRGALTANLPRKLNTDKLQAEFVARLGREVPFRVRWNASMTTPVEISWCAENEADEPAIRQVIAAHNPAETDVEEHAKKQARKSPLEERVEALEAEVRRLRGR